jgi:hypothetical protein
LLDLQHFGGVQANTGQRVGLRHQACHAGSRVWHSARSEGSHRFLKILGQ